MCLFFMVINLKTGSGKRINIGSHPAFHFFRSFISIFFVLKFFITEQVGVFFYFLLFTSSAAVDLALFCFNTELPNRWENVILNIRLEINQSPLE